MTSRLLQILLALASVVTALVAIWLFTVIVWVLPERDPARIPLWTGVAIGFLVYAGLCLAYLVVGSRLLRMLVLTLSVIAMALGAYGVAQVVRTSSSDRHFEGYLLIMGLILACHGMVAFTYTAMSQ